MSKSNFRDIDVETFAFGNTRSIRALTPNGPGEEISPQSYLRFLQVYVQRRGGVVDQDDLEAEIEKHFGGIWGPDDLRPLRIGGRHPRPKWKNSLDWAKVMARKLDPPILSRSARRQGKKFTLIVLISPTADPEMVAWVQRTPKKKFRKKCPGCRRWVRLSALVCPFCGSVFPHTSARKHKLPRERK
jgi:hypothetical protein